MKRFIFSFALLLCFQYGVLAQLFEGEVIYDVKYVSKNPKMTDQQMNYLLGNWQSFYIKGANYKSTMNGKLSVWQLFISKEAKLYNKTTNTETIFWMDVNKQDDEVLKSELNKNVVEVLGYKCDELILTCKSGIQKYYFNAALAADPELYKVHKYGNWYDYLKLSKALPLKSVIETTLYTMTQTATEIKPKKIEDDYFKLPPGVETAKSPN